MAKLLLKSRYLILLPILGLALAAAVFFVLGGIGLIRLLYESVLTVLNAAPEAHKFDQGKFIYEVVEYVHTFLIGTVLYITAVGFYQLFIQEISFPSWLKIESTEELETNLIGVTVVVLAVNFMGAIFRGRHQQSASIRRRDRAANCSLGPVCRAASLGNELDKRTRHRSVPTCGCDSAAWGAGFGAGRSGSGAG